MCCAHARITLALCCDCAAAQVVVIVDEEGTEAAAVTACVAQCACVIYEMPKRVCIDRPFVFLVVDDASRTPLFMGCVHDPSAATE